MLKRKTFKQNKTSYVISRFFFCLLSSFLNFTPISAEENQDFYFTSKAYCTIAEASWKPIEGVSYYHLKYRPSLSNELWKFIDLPSSEISYSAELWDDAKFDIQLEAFDLQSNPLALSAENKVVTGNFLQAPVFDITTDGLTAQLIWSGVESATGYILVYKRYGTEIRGIKEFDANTFSYATDLWDGAFFSIAMISKGKNGQVSRISQLKNIVVGEKPNLSDVDLSFRPFVNVKSVFPAIETTLNAILLKDCLYSESRTESCTFERLPLIGQRFSTPSVDNIMEHVLVSSIWMAERFRQVLERMPTESLKLFKSLTGVVISSDIRASNYRPMTGAMYINPSSLWLDQAEKDELSLEGDPRQGCGDRLSYDYLFDFQINNEWMRLNHERSRSIKTITLQLSSIIFHELVHANDFFPTDRLSFLSKQLKVSEAFFLNSNYQISNNVSKQFPLRSLNLKRMAKIENLCLGITCSQLDLNPQTIADDLSKEAANSVYSFMNPYEDIAVIGEEVLMSYFFDAKRLSLITDKATRNSSNYPVYWGTLGFRSDTDFRNKAKAIMSRVLPEIDFSAYIDNLPAADVIPPGKEVYEVLFPKEKGATIKRKADFKHLKKLTKLPYL